MPSLPMTQSAAQALLSQYIPVVFAAIQDKYSITNLRDKLMNTEKVVLKTAKQVYELFTINGRNGSQLSTIDDVIRFEKELNEEIKRAKKVSESISNIGNLNGPELEKNFLSLYEKAEIFDRDLQQQWDNFLKQTLSNKNITSITDKIIMENSKDIAQAIIENLIKPGAFTKASLGSTGMVNYVGTNEKGSNVGHNVGRVNEVFSKSGKKIQQAFRDYLKDKTSNNNDSEIVFVETSQASTYNGVSITLKIEQNQVTLPIESLLKMRKEERDKFFSGMSEEKKANFVRIINESYKQYILEKCGQNSDSNLAKAIDKVIDFKDSDTLLKAFFGGGMNTKNITGILGEIQTIYFLMCLGGEQLIDSISWIGGIAKEGQKPHADLLLKRIIGEQASNYGIQVKNTSKDISKTGFSATFQSFNFKQGVFDKETGLLKILHTEEAKQAMTNLGLPGLDSNLMEAIETLIGMEGFNIEYQRVRQRNGRNTTKTKTTTKLGEQVWQAVAAENQQFSETRHEIEVGAAAAQQIMAFFATSMMYMQRVGNTFGESNTVYFVAGTLIMSAATIVSKMLDEWQNYSERSFNMEIGRQSGKGLTIVDVINAGGDKAFNKLDLGFNSNYTFVKQSKG